MHFRFQHLILACTAGALLSACGGFAPEPLYSHENPFPTPGKMGELDEAQDPMLKQYNDIRAAVLKDHCLSCHNPQNAKGGVDLSSLPAILKHPGLVKWGQSNDSDLYNVILEGSMPPREMLSDELTERVRIWIDGA